MQPGDARAKTLKANSVAAEKRSEELAWNAVVEAEALKTQVFDAKVDAPAVIIDEIISVGASLTDDAVIVRTIATIDSMTYGYGNEYSFKAGVKYKVPRDLADHLESLGYLYTA